MNSEKLAWYVARSSGITAWVLATASIVFGLALSTRLVRRRGVPAWLNALHRYLGTLTLVFTAVHLGALVADNWVHFGIADLFVPMASGWRPGAVAWGIVSMYLLVAVQVTSWLKRHLPRRLWHGIHLTSIPMFVTGTVHGLQSGADRKNLVVQWGVLTGSVVLLFLVMFRLLSESRSRRNASRGRGSDGGSNRGGDEERLARVAALSRAPQRRNPLGHEGLDRGVEPAVREVRAEVR